MNYFETNDQLRFFWDIVKPLLLGKCYARIINQKSTYKLSQRLVHENLIPD